MNKNRKPKHARSTRLEDKQAKVVFKHTWEINRPSLVDVTVFSDYGVNVTVFPFQLGPAE